MENNQNENVTMELSVKLQLDQRLMVLLKRQWVVAIVVALVQLLVWILKAPI